MRKHNKKDKKRRTSFSPQELNQILLKTIVLNENLSRVIKWNAVLKSSNLSNNQNKVRFVSRCLFTNRKAKFNRTFKKFSRLSFIRFARFGYISGLKKSSW
jgi:ribosomal protein S14